MLTRQSHNKLGRPTAYQAE